MSERLDDMNERVFALIEREIKHYEDNPDDRVPASFLQSYVRLLKVASDRPQTAPRDDDRERRLMERLGAPQSVPEVDRETPDAATE